MDIALVGAGRVGTALAVLLSRAGHRIVGVAGREGSRARAEEFLPEVPFLPAADAVRDAAVAVLGVPDDAIAAVCADLAADGAFGQGHSVTHLSGSTPLLALGPARAAGTRVLAMHPLQTVPDVEAGIDRLPGSAVAVTAWGEDAFVVGERLARDVGGRPFRVAEERKALYHAAAVFCSNYLVAVEAMAERLFRAAGVDNPREAFGPLARATLDNVLQSGPEASLTGPVARGDAGTVRRNLEALSSHTPQAVPAYLALARVVLDLAERSGRLSAQGVGDVREVLGAWR
jgi:predicted short-subunit dehydrogenase-like oxidoreductase (DUF2520 family)